MTRARQQQISLDDTPFYHCMARCVRRAFLCGEDALTDRSYEHRKAWIVDRLRELADVFAIDVCAYAILGNHYLCGAPHKVECDVTDHVEQAER